MRSFSHDTASRETRPNNGVTCTCVQVSGEAAGVKNSLRHDCKSQRVTGMLAHVRAWPLTSVMLAHSFSYLFGARPVLGGRTATLLVVAE